MEDHQHIYNKKPDIALFVCYLMGLEDVFALSFISGEQVFTSQTLYNVRKIAYS